MFHEGKFLEGREVPRRKGSSMKEGKFLEGRKFLAQLNESSTNQTVSSRTLLINTGYILYTSSVTLMDLNFTQGDALTRAVEAVPKYVLQ